MLIRFFEVKNKGFAYWLWGKRAVKTSTKYDLGYIQYYAEFDYWLLGAELILEKQRGKNGYR